MKYKLIGLVSFVTALFLILGISAFSSENNKTRYIQHLSAPEKSVCTNHSDGVLCSHLPLVSIDTGGAEIPGKAVRDHVNHTTKVTRADDGSKTINANFAVIDNEKTNNHITDKPQTESKIQIRVRGNSSRHFDKSGYLVKLINDDGTNNPQKIMGMDAHQEWVMHGPFLDKTLIRNYMWYNISGSLMDYAPNVRFCEVVLNGEYIGVYLMCETITSGKNGGRIPLEVGKKDNTFTGYILRHDRGSEADVKNIEPFSIYSLHTDKKINIVYPGASNLTPELARNIELDFSAFEKAIYSYDFDDKEFGYTGTVDVESFVYYFLINEVSINRDAGLYSTYMYKDTDDKYKMCVWDFNNALDNYEEVENPAEGFAMWGTLWYNRIIQDDAFTDKIIKKYRKLRKGIFSDEYLNTFIDDTIEYLGDAIDRNYEKWGYSFLPEYDRLIPKERNVRSYDEAVEKMKNSLKNRLIWLDNNIESIRQYSAVSKTRESHEMHE